LFLEPLETRFLLDASTAQLVTGLTAVPNGATIFNVGSPTQAMQSLGTIPNTQATFSSLSNGTPTLAVQSLGTAQATPALFPFATADTTVPTTTSPSPGVPYGFPGRVVLPGTGVTERSAGPSGPLEQTPGQYLSGGGGNNGLLLPENAPAPPPPPPSGPLGLEAETSLEVRDLALTTFLDHS
jgi:hypothetical protein